jgi:hypothetical protein
MHPCHLMDEFLCRLHDFLVIACDIHFHQEYITVDIILGSLVHICFVDLLQSELVKKGRNIRFYQSETESCEKAFIAPGSQEAIHRLICRNMKNKICIAIPITSVSHKKGEGASVGVHSSSVYISISIWFIRCQTV